MRLTRRCLTQFFLIFLFVHTPHTVRQDSISSSLVGKERETGRVILVNVIVDSINSDRRTRTGGDLERRQ